MLTSISHAAVSWPLKICSSGASGYLCDQNNVPFAIVGDAAWSGAIQLDTTGSTDYKTYIDDRADKGFTAIIVRALTHLEGDNAPSNQDNEHPFTNGSYDWSVRNENYWSSLDTLLDYAKSRNIVVFLSPAYLGYNCGNQGWYAEMNAQTNADMTDYGEFIGSRYANQGNIIWLQGGDADCSLCSNACDRINAIANAISSANGDNGAHLQTAHSYRSRSALDDYDQSWLDLNSTYSLPADCAGEIQNDYQRSGALPYLFIEGWYEGEHSTTVLDWQGQALIAYFGGALLGHIFGNTNIWDFDASWVSALESTGSYSMGNIARLIKSRKWWTLVPDYDSTVVTSSKGSGTSYHATAKSDNNETVLVWCANTNTVTVDMSEINGTSAKAWWWDPDDNTYELIGTYATSGTRDFTPGESRLVLVLDNLDSGLAPPGSTPYATQTILLQEDWETYSTGQGDERSNWDCLRGIFYADTVAAAWNESEIVSTAQEGSKAVEIDSDGAGTWIAGLWGKHPSCNSDGEFRSDITVSVQVRLPSGTSWSAGNKLFFVQSYDDENTHNQAGGSGKPNTYAAYYMTIAIDADREIWGQFTRSDLCQAGSGELWTDYTQNVSPYDVTPLALSEDTYQKIDFRMKLNTPGSSNGLFKMWVDGVLIIDYSNVDYQGDQSGGCDDGFNHFNLLFYPLTSISNSYFLYDDITITENLANVKASGLSGQGFVIR